MYGTVVTGLSEDLRDIRESRKTAVINNELLRLQVDIAVHQETHMADSGSCARGILLLSGRERAQRKSVSTASVSLSETHSCC